MGRPPLKGNADNTATIVFRMPKDVRDRIKAIAGENRMAAFIREAIERELKRRENGE